MKVNSCLLIKTSPALSTHRASMQDFKKHIHEGLMLYMHGGGPSPSGSSFLHSYGLAAVSKAHTSARGRLPVENASPVSKFRHGDRIIDQVRRQNIEETIRQSVYIIKEGSPSTLYIREQGNEIRQSNHTPAPDFSAAGSRSNLGSTSSPSFPLIDKRNRCPTNDITCPYRGPGPAP